MNMTQHRSKTFLWLLAEFTVIVIGVLVALAVDEWRDGRANSRLERFYLESLAADLAKDSLEFINFARQQDRRARAAAIALRAAQNSSVDSVYIDPDAAGAVTPAMALGTVGQTNHLEPARAAYMTLTSTGAIAIITDPDIRRRIIDYYVAVDDHMDINDLIERELQVYKRRLEEFGYTPNDREKIVAGTPLADPAFVASIRGLRAQALNAAGRGKDLIPMATDLRARILRELDD